MAWKTCWLFLLCLHIIMWFYYDWSGRLTLSFLGILNDQMLNPTLFVWFPQVRPWFCITIEDNKGNPFSYADMKITGAGEDVTLTFRDLSTILTPHYCSSPEAWKRTFTRLKTVLRNIKLQWMLHFGWISQRFFPVNIPSHFCQACFSKFHFIKRVLNKNGLNISLS